MKPRNKNTVMVSSDKKITVEFYVVGKKGHTILIEFVKKFGVESIAFVMAAKDKGVQDDYFDEIQSFCCVQCIEFKVRNKNLPSTGKTTGDYKFSIGWRWLINEPINLIVFHDSPLPKWRGFAPLVNMLISGENTIGVTALIANMKYDEGNILAQELIEIEYPIKICEAIDKLIPLYINLTIYVYRLILSGTLVGRVQNERLATYSLWRDDEDYFINWHDDAKDIARFCDSVGYPYEGAKTYINGEVYRVLSVEVYLDVVVEHRIKHIGKTIFMQDGCPVVICGNGLLKILKLENGSAHNAKIVLPFRSRFT